MKGAYLVATFFHEACVGAWLDITPNCPNCRVWVINPTQLRELKGIAEEWVRIASLEYQAALERVNSYLYTLSDAQSIDYHGSIYAEGLDKLEVAVLKHSKAVEHLRKIEEDLRNYREP